jgi:hypothetical protein
MLDMRWPAACEISPGDGEIKEEVRRRQDDRLRTMNLNANDARLTSLLATLAVRHVLIVYQDTPLLHQPDLLFIVGLEIYVCLQSTGNGLGGGGCGCSVGVAGWGDGGVRFSDSGHRCISLFVLTSVCIITIICLIG